ncbi:hypothetical protein ABH944_004435 [Caballeronia udeis]|uniref:Uncharacterized protein n=1 Tax=Caballeronia udeis TaxID=1232866 RepID=A0ABW8MLV4_9BURK
MNEPGAGVAHSVLRVASAIRARHPYLFDLIDSVGYGGWIGCEYPPRADTSNGPGWLMPKRHAGRAS